MQGCLRKKGARWLTLASLLGLEGAGGRQVYFTEAVAGVRTTSVRGCLCPAPWLHFPTVLFCFDGLRSNTALNQRTSAHLLLCLHSPLSAPCPLRSDSRKNSIRRARSCLWGPRSNNAQKQFARGTHSHSFCLFEPFLVHVFCSFSHSFHNYAHFQFLIYNFLICYRVSRYSILSR